MTELKDRVVLVTGGARGLGEAICRTLSRSGAIIAIADLRAELAENLRAQLLDAGARAMTLQFDVGDENQAERAISAVVERYGRLDALINNAGTDVTLPVTELSFDDWDRIIRTNLRGPFVLSKLALPVMQRQGGGHIVNIASTAARRAWPNASAYHASKWGLLGLSHALLTEARPHNIKVTAVICGGMRTPFLLDRFPDIDEHNLQNPQNVAETIRFVLSQPAETVIPEVMVLPMRETSWP